MAPFKERRMRELLMTTWCDAPALIAAVVQQVSDPWPEVLSMRTNSRRLGCSTCVTPSKRNPANDVNPACGLKKIESVAVPCAHSVPPPRNHKPALLSNLRREP